MDPTELGRTLGTLDAKMDSIEQKLDSMVEDYRCVPQRLSLIEAWKSALEERAKRLAGAKWTFGLSVVALAVKSVWDWAEQLLRGPRP